MTLGSADLPASPPPTTSAPGPPDKSAIQAPSLTDALWFWPTGIFLALVTWWPLGIRPASGLQGGDTYTYFFPLKAWYAERLCAGELPLWNPLVGHGFPALGESQTGVFYPFHLLLYRFAPLNTAYHLNFLVHYVLAFGFTCHFVRRLHFSILECILAAVVFVYGWFPARSCLEWAIITGAWIPLAFCGVERFVTESRPRFLLATQFAILMQLLAGHFNLAFVTIFGLALYGALRLLLERKPWSHALRQILCVAIAIGLASGMASIQLVPSWELKARSQRAAAEFGEHQVGYGAIPWSYLPQAIQPWKFYPRLNEPIFERQQFGVSNTNKVEAHLYFGLIPMTLAALAVLATGIRAIARQSDATDRTVWTWLLVGAIGLTFAIGMWTAAAVHLPGFGYFTGPGRYGVLVQLAIGVLASSGARRVGQWVAARTPVHSRITGAGTFIACIAMALVTEGWTAWAGGGETFFSTFVPIQAGWLTAQHCAWGMLLAWIVFASVAQLLRRPEWTFSGTAAMLAWMDLVLAARYVQFAEIRWDSPIQLRDISTVGTLLTPSWPHARLLARDQNAVSLCGVATVPVYLGIGPREYFGGPLQIPAEFHWDSSFNATMTNWLRWAGVTHVLSFDPIVDDDLPLLWRGYDPFLHAMLGRPADQPLWLYFVRGTRARCYRVPADEERQALDEHAAGSEHMTQVPEVMETANDVTITVESDQSELVVLTELLYPGWEVQVDGCPDEPVAGTVFRAVRIGPGTHVIQWRYRPWSLRIGIILSLFSLLATGLVVKRYG